MKKLLFALSFLSAIALSSCNSMGDYEIPPTYGGQVIYSNVSFQHAVSSEPTNVAFRLLIWIKDGKITDNDNFKKLFGNLTAENIVEAPAGVYTITYPSNYENNYDNKKTGAIEINTNENMLENASEEWTISLVTDAPLKIVTRQTNSYNDIHYTFSACYTTITANGFDSWSINANTTVDWPKVENEIPQLVWSANNSISLTPATGESITTTFDKFVKGAVNVEAYSSEDGTMSIFNQAFTWDVDETLIYKMSCPQQTVSVPFISKGSLMMSFDTTDPLNNPIDKNTFPVKYTDISFEPISGGCGARGLLEYNGFQLSF